MKDFFNFTKDSWFTNLSKVSNASDSDIINTPKESVSDAPEVILDLLAYTDYFLIIAVIILALILGLYKYENKYKSNIYLLCMVAVLGYIGIKEIAKSYYENSDEKFLISTWIVLSVLLLGYLFLIQEQQKLQNITVDYPILVLIAFFGLLITIENEEGMIIFLGLEIQAFICFFPVSRKAFSSFLKMHNYPRIIHSYRNYKNTTFATVLIGIQKDSMLIKISKRSMHKAREYAYSQYFKIAYQRTFITTRVVPQSLERRSYATITQWSMKTRVQWPIKGGESKPGYTMYDKLTGYEIMFPRDISGHNHPFIVDETFLNDVYFLVLGSFTSTNKPIDGITPIKISDHLFNGNLKDQYYLPYPKPKLILKELAKTAKWDVFETSHAFFRTPDHEKFSAGLTPPPRDLY